MPDGVKNLFGKLLILFEKNEVYTMIESSVIEIQKAFFQRFKAGSTSFGTVSRVLILFFTFSLSLQAQNLDIDALERIHVQGQGQQNQFFQGLTTSADYVAILTPVSMLGVGLASKNKELTRKGIQSGIAVLGTYGVGFILKKTIDRPRPWQDYPQISPYQLDDGSSFTSGSTSVAFAAATSITSSFPKWYVAVPAYTFASAVGYSRLRLGAHYPSDVLAGAVIGTASVWVAGKLTKLINK